MSQTTVIISPPSEFVLPGTAWTADKLHLASLLRSWYCLYDSEITMEGENKLLLSVHGLVLKVN